MNRTNLEETNEGLAELSEDVVDFREKAVGPE